MSASPQAVRSIRSVEDLEENLSRPTDALVEMMGRLDGDIVFLGVAGKMGPTLARMARRADELAGKRRELIGVSRFSDPDSRAALEANGVRTIAADLLEEEAVDALPAAKNVFYLPALKFGSTGQEPRTWAINIWLPGAVCRRYRESRIVAMSTGNVYGYTPVGRPSRESDTPAPVGEYAMSCLGRERMFQYFSAKHQTPVVLVRLNYATELRYGVLVDIARKVRLGEAIDLTMGHLNTIWQADANARILQLLESAAAPAAIFNLTGNDVLRVADLARELGARLGCEPVFTGEGGADALVADNSRLRTLLGDPGTSLERMLDLTAEWVSADGESLGKPTGFEVRSGKF